MVFEQRLARTFAMSEAVWRRHANPWSVWTRYPLLPLFSLAVWGRVWIGGWSLLPLALLVLWTWLNPRVFPPPASTDNWASKAVLGERVWLNRGSVPIPAHHLPVVRVLYALTGLGMVALVYGLAALHLGACALGLITVVLGKTWFLDRMVWLFDEMADRHPPYREWLY